MPDNRNNLRNILDDLWGSSDALAAENARRLSELTRELSQSSGIELPVTEQAGPMSPNLPGEEKPAAPAPKAAAEKKAEKPAFPPFEEFWKLSDETVDWTDALSFAQPQEEGVDPELWSFFHENAEKVLSGDLPTYVNVLKKANPLGNVRPYAKGFNVHAESADRLTVCFDAINDYLKGNDEADRHYLAGISLRCARDLMAVLPVREVAVTAKVKSAEALNVTFTRAALQKVRFGFVDPEAFVRGCGGTFVE